MILFQIILALIFAVAMITAKRKWVIPMGWGLIFVAGTLLYSKIISTDLGRFDIGVVLTAAMSSVRNFLINNDFVSYADKVNPATYTALNIVCVLSVFLTTLTAVKIILAYFSDKVYLFFFGKNKHICIFTDDSADTVHLAQTVIAYVKNSLCVFLNCDRISELETEKNIIFIKSSERLSKYKSDVFICSEDAGRNAKMFKKLKRQLSQSKYYVFADDLDCTVNKEELLVRYLFAANDFIPAKYINNKQAKICIVGGNKLAVELCKELIVQCQNVNGIPQITIIGEDAENNFAFFVKSNPGLSNCAELVFVNAHPMSVAGIGTLTDAEYCLYFFCDGNKNLSGLVPSDKVVMLPEYEVIFDYDIIANFSLDKEAKELNAEYERHYGKGKDGTFVDADAEWRILSEFQRDSNRAQAINIPSKKHLHSIGLSLEQLAIEEHLRWNAFHYVNGWTYGKGPDGQKVAESKLHPCLVSYDKLPQVEKDKDMLFINRIFSK